MVFNSSYSHLNIPDQWNEYFSKYPNGYTILEAVINWAGQVNDMADTLNSTTDYVNNFMVTFDQDLSDTTKEILTQWQADGTLGTLINQALQTDIGDITKLITPVKTDLVGAINSIYNDYNDLITVDIKEKGAKCDGVTDDSAILQQWIDNLFNQRFGNLLGGVILIPGDMLVMNTINLKSNVYLIGAGTNISRIRTTVGSSGNGLNVLSAMNQTNIKIANLRIEGTGYGSGGSNFTPIGSMVGAGSCIVAGNCSHFIVEDCHLYNGGGFNDSDGVGNIWISCCTNSKIINNVIEKSDNSICVDRWYSNYNADGVDRSGIYNDGVVISGNNCFNGSGRGVSMENINGFGSISIINNTFTSLQYAGIEGRDFTNCVIMGNTFEGSPALKTTGNTSDFMAYGVCVENTGIKCIISNNNFQNLRIHGIQLLNADEFVITGNRISNVTGNDGIFIKNASNDGGVTGDDLATGIVANNLLVNVDVGIYVKRDSSDPSHIDNVSITGNLVKFRTTGIQVEYGRWFNIVGNQLIPVTTYGGSTGIYLINTFRCQVVDNNIQSTSNGVHVSGDDSTNFRNRHETVTNANTVSTSNYSVFEDIIRGGSTAFVLSGGGNTGLDARKTKFMGTITQYKDASGIPITIYSTAIPTTGIWDKGDMMYNSSPDPAEYIGYTYTGSAWKGFGAIEA